MDYNQKYSKTKYIKLQQQGSSYNNKCLHRNNKHGERYVENDKNIFFEKMIASYCVTIKCQLDLYKQ